MGSVLFRLFPLITKFSDPPLAAIPAGGLSSLPPQTLSKSYISIIKSFQPARPYSVNLFLCRERDCVFFPHTLNPHPPSTFSTLFHVIRRLTSLLSRILLAPPGCNSPFSLELQPSSEDARHPFVGGHEVVKELFGISEGRTLVKENRTFPP